MDGKESQQSEYFTRTPLARRLPTAVVLAIALTLANTLGHTLWLGLVIFLATIVVGIVILHVVFGQSLDRLIQAKEFIDD